MVAAPETSHPARAMPAGDKCEGDDERGAENHPEN
jgi:hypothetical protein